MIISIHTFLAEGDLHLTGAKQLPKRSLCRSEGVKTAA